MAKITFQRKEFEKEIKITKEVEEKISLFGTHLESLTDDSIELEILPNRPDLFSFQGFVRAFKAFLGKPVDSKYKISKGDNTYKVKIDSSVKDVRPFTACAIVKNLKFDDSKIKNIIDIQEKLHATLGRNRKKLAIGVYPLEKITLPIKYEARNPQEIRFIPLEMSEEMNGLQILQRHPTGREYAKLLEGYHKFPVFVDGKGKVLSMPPIINSHETGKISPETTSVFIECSGFNLPILNKTLNIIVTALADMGGKIYSMELDYGKKIITPNLAPETMKLSLDNVNSILGLNLKESDLVKLAPRMGYEYSNGKVKFPAWRTDILHEVDIIEDIAIAYGYDKIAPEIPEVATTGIESKESKIKVKISDILSGLGLQEISSYHLIKGEDVKDSEKESYIEVLDSKTDYKYLRNSLLVPCLRMFSENKDNEYPQKVFEIGTIFKKDKNNKAETGVDEKEHLLIALSPSNFTEIKQICDYLFKNLGLSYELKESTHKDLIEGRTGAIVIDKKDVGCIGEMHPNTLKDWGMKMPIAMININLDEIFGLL